MSSELPFELKDLESQVEISYVVRFLKFTWRCFQKKVRGVVLAEMSNNLALPELYFHWSQRHVGSIFIRVLYAYHLLFNSQQIVSAWSGEGSLAVRSFAVPHQRIRFPELMEALNSPSAMISSLAKKATTTRDRERGCPRLNTRI